MTAPYIVSKAAVFSLTECLAHDLASIGSRIGASVLVPSAIDTGIARSARVRPARFGTDHTETGPMVLGFLAQTTEAGMSPDAVTGPVLDAVRSGEFLIPTKPSYAAQLENRYTRLVERRLPGMSSSTENRRPRHGQHNEVKPGTRQPDGRGAGLRELLRGPEGAKTVGATCT